MRWTSRTCWLLSRQRRYLFLAALAYLLKSPCFPYQLSNLVDEMAADPDDKHMPASVRTAYRCEKDPTGDLNRDSLINHINEIALNTPDKEEKVKFEAGVKRGKVYVPQYNEAQLAAQDKESESQVRLDPDMEEALQAATLKDIMELADILNSNPQVTPSKKIIVNFGLTGLCLSVNVLI